MLKKLGLFFIMSVLVLSRGSLEAGEIRPSFRIFETSSGQEIKLESLLSGVQDSDVVFIGEEHDDKTARFLELEILKGLHQRNGNTSLALEFFERDIQVIMDEYLGGLITEEHFLASARPPSSYKGAYCSLIEYARQNRLEVIAANAPRRYVNMVTRKGIESLNKLSPEAKEWLAPLPISLPEGRYLKKLENNAERMEGVLAKMPEAKGADNSLIKMRNVLKMRKKQRGGLQFANQGLWDATMAYSLAQKFKEKGGPLMMICGSFHCDEGLGIVTQLRCYLPGARTKIISIKPAFSLDKAVAERFFDSGDFVILTKR